MIYQEQQVRDFQSGATKDGAHYHKTCIEALERYGFSITKSNLRVPDCGVDVDVVARNARGVQFMIECKGGYDSGKKPGGFKSSDNVRKAIASAFCLSQSEEYTGEPYTPLLVMTTYITPVTSVSYTQLSVVSTSIMLDVVSDRDSARLKFWARVDWFHVQGFLHENPTVDWAFRSNSFWGLPQRKPEPWKA